MIGHRVIRLDPRTEPAGLEKRLEQKTGGGADVENTSRRAIVLQQPRIPPAALAQRSGFLQIVGKAGATAEEIAVAVKLGYVNRRRRPLRIGRLRQLCVAMRAAVTR